MRNKNVERAGIGVVLGIMVFLIVNVAIGRPLVPVVERDFQPPVTDQPLDLDPESLYSSNCAVCHQADGQGMAGQFPPLSGSRWVLEDPATPVRVMLVGIQGEIEVQGETYNGVMPAQGHLTDEQIALLATHVRQSFGNDASAVEPELVAEVRAELSGRTTPWNGGEELSAVAGGE